MYVQVRVVPGAKKESVTVVSDTILNMAVREPAERNLANTRVRELVAAHYGIETRNVRLIAGHRSPRKVFDVQLLV